MDNPGYSDAEIRQIKAGIITISTLLNSMTDDPGIRLEIVADIVARIVSSVADETAREDLLDNVVADLQETVARYATCDCDACKSKAAQVAAAKERAAAMTADVIAMVSRPRD